MSVVSKSSKQNDVHVESNWCLDCWSCCPR